MGRKRDRKVGEEEKDEQNTKIRRRTMQNAIEQYKEKWKEEGLKIRRRTNMIQIMNLA